MQHSAVGIAAAILMVLNLGQGLSAQTLALHLEPSKESAQVLVIELPNPDVTQLPAEEGVELPQGWQRFIWEGGISGYVPVSEIGKNLEPVHGAPVHLDNNLNSAILIEVNEVDPVEILETGDWWRVFVEIPVVLFGYVPPTLAAQAEVTGLEEILAPMIEPTPETAGTAPVRETVAPISGPLTLAPTLQRPEVPTQARSPRVRANVAGMPILFEGVFQRAPQGLFARSPHSFQLLTADGQRIAWLDTADLVLSGTMADWLGRTVILQGEESARGSRGDLVIKVRSIRLK